MIPKIIHYVWLSGEEKPEVYQKCLDSWQRFMPVYEYKEWTLKNLPAEVLNHPFVSEAIKAKKWAYATDYIRVWALYNHGGIYLDLDVEVFKSFDPFLKHRAFSCTEFNPNIFYNEIKKLNKKGYTIKGLNIEAAVLGAEKAHPWIKGILEYYNGLKFINEQKYLFSIIMPRIVTKETLKYGFRYFPLYQILDEDIHIYPPDTFSYLFDYNRIKTDFKSLENNPIRFARHLVAHGWFGKNSQETIGFNLKKLILIILGKKIVNKFKSIFSKAKLNV